MKRDRGKKRDAKRPVPGECQPAAGKNAETHKRNYTPTSQISTAPPAPAILALPLQRRFLVKFPDSKVGLSARPNRKEEQPL